MQINAFIFARAGSKGVPGKNIRPLAGKPLIAYAIEAAKKSRHVSRVIVSTDDEAIARVARDFGAETPFMRPGRLAADDSPEWLAWRHAVEQLPPFDIFVSVPATCPFRDASDIDRCIERLLALPDADIVITTAPSHSNPYFTMVAENPDGSLRPAASTGSAITRRQDAPKIADIVGVAYATRPDFILRAKGLWDGKLYGVEVPQERALDIDTPHDFLIAELLMRHRQGE